MTPSKRDEHNNNDEPLPREVTPGGSEVVRHEPSFNDDDDFEVPMLSEADHSALLDHIGAVFGPVQSVLDEIIPTGLPMPVAVIPPDGDDRPFYTLITVCMSAAPMTTPGPEELEDGEPYDGPALAELVMTLPASWPIDAVMDRDDESDEDDEGDGDEEVMPIINWLRNLARLPMEYDTFLGVGHTIPNGDPPEPISDACPFVGFLILPQMIAEPKEDGRDGADLVRGDEYVSFLQVVPLFAEEMDFKLEAGIEALLERFESADIPQHMLADPTRPNVALD
jgi:hypothetical protein